MPSTIRDLTELTAVASDDYILISDTSDVTNRDKRISKINFSGGLMTGGYTLTMTSNGGLNLAGFTLTAPATGVVAMQDVTQTLTNKTLSTPITTGRAHLGTGVGNEYMIQEAITLGDIGATQVLTIDLTYPSGASTTVTFVTDFALSLQRSANASTWAAAYGKVSWHGTQGGAFTVSDSTTSFRSSGTVTGSVTAITGGIRISIQSSTYSNILTLNMFYHMTVGFAAQNIVVTPTIT